MDLFRPEFVKILTTLEQIGYGLHEKNCYKPKIGCFFWTFYGSQTCYLERL
jgi:hypothetical protein